MPTATGQALIGQLCFANITQAKIIFWLQLALSALFILEHAPLRNRACSFLIAFCPPDHEEAARIKYFYFNLPTAHCELLADYFFFFFFLYLRLTASTNIPITWRPLHRRPQWPPALCGGSRSGNRLYASLLYDHLWLGARASRIKRCNPEPTPTSTTTTALKMRFLCL